MTIQFKIPNRISLLFIHRGIPAQLLALMKLTLGRFNRVFFLFSLGFFTCIDPRHWNFPLTMMASLVQRASHSSIEWDVRTTDCPPRIMSKIQFQSKRLAPGSIPVVGSSWKNVLKLFRYFMFKFMFLNVQLCYRYKTKKVFHGVAHWVGLHKPIYTLHQALTLCAILSHLKKLLKSSEWSKKWLLPQLLAFMKSTLGQFLKICAELLRPTLWLLFLVKKLSSKKYLGCSTCSPEKAVKKVGRRAQYLRNWPLVGWK